MSVEDAIKLVVDRGFRVTINCTLFQGEDPDEVARFFDYAMTLGVEGITISPGYSYEKAPRQDVFLSRKKSKELMEDTNWEKYGTGKNPKCDNCMAHCGYEGTAVDDTFANPIKALKVHLRGPKTEGTMAEELPITYEPIENFERRTPNVEPSKT